jgi:hypothetical protein
MKLLNDILHANWIEIMQKIAIMEKQFKRIVWWEWQVNNSCRRLSLKMYELMVFFRNFVCTQTGYHPCENVEKVTILVRKI